MINYILTERQRMTINDLAMGSSQSQLQPDEWQQYKAPFSEMFSLDILLKLPSKSSMSISQWLVNKRKYKLSC